MRYMKHMDIYIKRERESVCVCQERERERESEARPHPSCLVSTVFFSGAASNNAAPCRLLAQKSLRVVRLCETASATAAGKGERKRKKETRNKERSFPSPRPSRPLL